MRQVACLKKTEKEGKRKQIVKYDGEKVNEKVCGNKSCDI
jgi:hypothetical protein